MIKNPEFLKPGETYTMIFCVVFPLELSTVFLSRISAESKFASSSQDIFARCKSRDATCGSFASILKKCGKNYYLFTSNSSTCHVMPGCSTHTLSCGKKKNKFHPWENCRLVLFCIITRHVFSSKLPICNIR